MIRSAVGWLEDKLQVIKARLENSAIAFFAAVVVGGITIAQFWVDFIAGQEERTERKASAIERAWQSLLTPMGGDTGKGNSLNFLLAEGGPLKGATLTCKNMGIWDEEDASCQEYPRLSGVIFPPAVDQLPAELFIWQQVERGFGAPIPYFEDVTISDSDLRRNVIGSEFGIGTEIERSRLSEALIAGSSALIYLSDLSGSVILADGQRSINTSNVTGAFITHGLQHSQNWFQWAYRPDASLGFDNWAWADDPPRHLLLTTRGGFLVWPDERWLNASGVTLCDPRYKAIPETSPKFNILNQRFTPHFELVRTFEVTPLGDPEIAHSDNANKRYFESLIMNTLERDAFCYPLSYTQAKLLWPEAYAPVSTADFLLKRFGRWLNKQSVLEFVERKERLQSVGQPD